VAVANVGVSFSLRHLQSADEVIELTRFAESSGYASVWIPEAWGRDAFTFLAFLAAKTTSIKLATGIVNVFSRTPALTAQSIASLDDISGGRAVLGLGASGQRVIEDWHGLRFEKVLQRTREYVEVVRLILAGDEIDYDGQVFALHAFSLDFKPPRRSVPIYIAALGPANVRLTGEVGDGWLPIFPNETILNQGRQWLSEGAACTGRSSAGLAVAPYIPTLLGDDAATLLRRHIAFYVGAMGSYYHRLMVRSGWAEEADAIRGAWQKGSSRQAVGLVTDEMLHAFTISGTPGQARQRLLEFRANGVTEPILTMPGGATPKAIRATLEALSGE
jgi:F420-dependent oxidoreductase-like protein